MLPRRCAQNRALPFLLLATLLLHYCVSAAADTNRLNIVFILADDLRPDALYALGNAQIETPSLDLLAARGSTFTHASCAYPICHVSRTEILTGRCLVGADTPGRPLKLDDTWTLWPEVMQRAGWLTIFSGKWHLQGTPWKRGFTETSALYSGGGAKGLPLTQPLSATGRKATGYNGWTFKTNRDEPQPELGVGLTADTDRIIADGAISAIHKHAARPFFLHVNFTASHDPLHWPRGMERSVDPQTLRLPANFRPQHPFNHGNIAGRDESIVPAPRTEEDVKRERAVYFALVKNLDAQVGRIIRALEEAGTLSHTLIIFSSDHGLALGSHGLMGKQNQYEHTTGVPLILAGPGIPSGKRFAAQTTLRDLYPTACDLARLAIPATVEGRSLLPVIRGEKAEIHDAIFGYFTDTQRMIRTADGWKFISYPKAGTNQLFNLALDPNELDSLASDPAHQERLKALAQPLKQWQQQHNDPIANPPAGK